ncbi:unnamed protein product [Withania somnifera]
MILEKHGEKQNTINYFPMSGLNGRVFSRLSTGKRLRSHFFFLSKESPLLVGTSLDKSINFIGERVYVVASSNGFLLCNKLRSRQRTYYVYNPTTKQLCYVVRSPLSRDKFQYSLTFESFSSETNVWTANELIVDVPFPLYPSRDEISSSSVGVVDGVFFWLDNYGQWMTVYDSVGYSVSHRLVGQPSLVGNSEIFLVEMQYWLGRML